MSLERCSVVYADLNFRGVSIVCKIRISVSRKHTNLCVIVEKIIRCVKKTYAKRKNRIVWETESATLPISLSLLERLSVLYKTNSYDAKWFSLISVDDEIESAFAYCLWYIVVFNRYEHEIVIGLI